LGVYGFDEETKRIKLLARHPGVTVEQIQANSGFEILIPEEVAETYPPTPEEQRILREIDPMGMVIGR
jgi:glutaconate CoA-transferase subunit B